jgi:hypothetical protein
MCSNHTGSSSSSSSSAVLLPLLSRLLAHASAGVRRAVCGLVAAALTTAPNDTTAALCSSPKLVARVVQQLGSCRSSTAAATGSSSSDMYYAEAEAADAADEQCTCRSGTASSSNVYKQIVCCRSGSLYNTRKRGDLCVVAHACRSFIDNHTAAHIALYLTSCDASGSAMWALQLGCAATAVIDAHYITALFLLH